MHDSKVIEVNGIFLGAAVALSDHAGWRVVAADARARCADGRIGKTYQDAQALARQAFWSFVPAASAPAAAARHASSNCTSPA